MFNNLHIYACMWLADAIRDLKLLSINSSVRTEGGWSHYFSILSIFALFLPLFSHAFTMNWQAVLCSNMCIVYSRYMNIYWYRYMSIEHTGFWTYTKICTYKCIAAYVFHALYYYDCCYRSFSRSSLPSSHGLLYLKPFHSYVVCIIIIIGSK